MSLLRLTLRFYTFYGRTLTFRFWPFAISMSYISSTKWKLPFVIPRPSISLLSFLLAGCFVGTNNFSVSTQTTQPWGSFLSCVVISLNLKMLQPLRDLSYWDVVLKYVDGRTFKAHKVILAMQQHLPTEVFHWKFVQMICNGYDQFHRYYIC